jgi:hypothetical protein
MKAPSVAPITAIQVFAEIAGVAGAAGAGRLAAALTVGWSVLMEASSRLQRQDALDGRFR